MASRKIRASRPALKSSITIERGHVVQTGFRDYPLLTIAEMPQVEVHIVPSRENPSGAGECGLRRNRATYPQPTHPPRPLRLTVGRAVTATLVDFLDLHETIDDVNEALILLVRLRAKLEDFTELSGIAN